MSTEIQVNVVGVLLDKFKRNFPFPLATLELIDNSLDARSTEIAMHEEEGNLVITDNGEGFANLARAIDLGESGKTGRIGRYGVGLKDASLRFSQTTRISSQGKQIEIPWEDIVNRIVPPTIDEPIPSEVVKGSRIELIGFRERFQGQIPTMTIRRGYWPLLSRGSLVIRINGVALAPLDLPAFTERIEFDIDFEGKRVSVFGGLYRHDDPMARTWAGYNLFYKGRLIGNGRITDHGVGEECCTNFAFLLNLEDTKDEAWNLATNKDDVEGLRELLDYIYHAHTREILIRGAQQTQNVDLREVEDAVNATGKGRGPITRDERVNKDTREKTKAKGRRKVRTNSQEEGAGQYERQSNGSNAGRDHARFRFQFVELDGNRLGEVQNQKQLVIKANTRNDFVAEQAKAKNKEAMIAMAKLIYTVNKRLRAKVPLSEDHMDAILVAAGEELMATTTPAAQPD